MHTHNFFLWLLLLFYRHMCRKSKQQFFRIYQRKMRINFSFVSRSHRMRFQWISVFSGWYSERARKMCTFYIDSVLRKPTSGTFINDDLTISGERRVNCWFCAILSFFAFFFFFNMIFRHKRNVSSLPIAKSCFFFALYFSHLNWNHSFISLKFSSFLTLLFA